MDKARETRRPRRSWTVIALVLVALALAQACGQSGSRTGPTTTTSPSALQLKLRRVGNAELPPGCTGGTYSVKGPGVNIQDAPLAADGNISVPLSVGLTYTFSVKVNCPPFGILAGSTTITVPPGGAQGQIVITVTRILGVGCDPSTVAPGETSTCTCNVQSLSAPSIVWKGVNSSNGQTATFSNKNPGVYTVTCTVNGVDTRSTTVEVKAPEAPPPPPPPPVLGTLQVTNTADDCSFCDVDVTFSPPTVAPIVGLGAGQTVQRNNLAPGSYVAMTNCSGNIPFQIQAGQTTLLQINGFDCG